MYGFLKGKLFAQILKSGDHLECKSKVNLVLGIERESNLQQKNGERQLLYSPSMECQSTIKLVLILGPVWLRIVKTAQKLICECCYNDFSILVRFVLDICFTYPLLIRIETQSYLESKI